MPFQSEMGHLVFNGFVKYLGILYTFIEKYSFSASVTQVVQMEINAGGQYKTWSQLEASYSVYFSPNFIWGISA